MHDLSALLYKAECNAVNRAHSLRIRYRPSRVHGRRNTND